MKVLINNKLVKLNERDVLGAGGEALVLRHEAAAVKLYHDPTLARAAKLEALLQLNPNLPPSVIFPDSPVYDQTGGQLIGFTMPALPGRMEVLAGLSNKSFRASHNVTLPQVAGLFRAIHPVVQAIHQAELVIGDFNDLNLLFDATNLAFIDVDSYQFDKWPCPVATETYLDPRLYGCDLTARPAFSPENDWYSFAVLLFRSLLLAHPYGGTHPQVKLLTERVRQRLTVFHPDVTYPKIGLSPAYLSDELAGVFQQIFGAGKSGVFPLASLEKYAAELIECSTCQAWFPSGRHFCPACQSLTTFVMPPVQLEAGVQAEELLSAAGPIIALRVVGQKLYAVAHEETSAVLYTIEPGQPPQRQPLFKWLPGARYEFMDGLLIVNPYATGDLLLLKIEPGGVTPLTKTSTGQFNGQAVFATTGSALYRTAGGMLMRGELKFGQLVERPVSAILEGQTWFQTHADSDGAAVVTGFSRIFRQLEWFQITERGGRTPLAITPLLPDEAMTEWAVKPGLVLRQTHQAGVNYLRLDALDPKGNLLFTQRRFLDEATEPKNIEGMLYANGVALWPGSTGLLREQLEKRLEVTLSATAPYLTPASRLALYHGNLLTVTDNRVWSVKSKI